VERPFNRRDISVRNEITEFSSEGESLRFAICRYCFDDEIGVRYFRSVEWSGNTSYTPRYLNQERNNSFLRKVKVCVLRFAGIVSTLKLACATFGV
jgi:hypothetical protein